MEIPMVQCGRCKLWRNRSVRSCPLCSIQMKQPAQAQETRMDYHIKRIRAVEASKKTAKGRRN